MNRSEARSLAGSTTAEEIRAMLARARAQIVQWDCASRINPSLSVGAAFNIFAACDPSKMKDLAKTNAIYEFGEFLPGYAPIKRTKVNRPVQMHQEPRPYPEEI